MRYIAVKLVCFLLSFNNPISADIQTTIFEEMTDSGSGFDDREKTDIEKPAYVEMTLGETTVNGIRIKDCVITADYWPNPDNHRDPCLAASIRYPQITEMQDESLQGKINKLLLNAATQALNHENAEDTLKLFDDIVNHGLNTFWSCDNEYHIVYAGDDRISVSYKGMSYFGGAYPSSFNDYITISLGSGEMVPFTDYFSKENVIAAIRSLEFDLFEGHYNPGGYEGHEPKIVEGFIAEVEELEDSFDTFMGNTYNFAMDDRFAYIEFPFYDSLNGYVVLRFNLDTLK